MRTIYKYPVPIMDEFTVTMPMFPQILDVQTQGESPQVWALVDTTADPIEHRFSLRGTGHSAEGLEDAMYVGSFQLHGGGLVFHLFYRGEA